MSVRGARVLITGASRGMGRLFALRAAREGAARLTLWGRDEAALADVAAEARELAALAAPAGCEVTTAVVDLAVTKEVDQAARRLGDAVAPDILINNAGVLTANAPAWELDPAEAERTLAVNTLAPMRLTSRLLPTMIADAPRPKRILNVVSASALLPVPRAAAYAASKAALLQWSDTLRIELAQAGHRHLAVTAYNPSYVDTGMFDGARPPLLTPLLRPERAVETGWRAMLAGRPQAVAPASVALSAPLRALLPTRAFDGLAGVLGVHGSMTEVRPRS